MASSVSRDRPSLESVPSEIRAIILDHVFEASNLISFDHQYRVLAPESWSVALLRTSSQLHADGQAALRRAFRRTTIKYRNCIPLPRQLWYDFSAHSSFVETYGRLFQCMEISRLAPEQINLSMYPNITRLIVGRFTHRMTPFYLPKMPYPRFSDILDHDILEAWRIICQSTRILQPRYPMEDLVIDAVDGRAGAKRRFKVLVRLVLEAKTKGNALIDVEESRVVERSPELSAGTKRLLEKAWEADGR